MHKNPFYLSFLAVLVAIAFWYTIDALSDVFAFKKLTHQTEVVSIDWDVESLSGDRYVPIGHYRFQVKGMDYEGETLLLSSVYRNAWAVQQQFQEIESQYKTVWYNRLDPSYNSLQKKFPTKECVTATFIWVIFLYFLGLGFYIGSKKAYG